MKEYNFEIYTCNEQTGEGGWDIKFRSVLAEDLQEAKAKLRETPHYDCIILFNYGCPVSGATLQALQDKMNGTGFFDTNN